MEHLSKTNKKNFNNCCFPAINLLRFTTAKPDLMLPAPKTPTSANYALLTVHLDCIDLLLKPIEENRNG